MSGHKISHTQLERYNLIDSLLCKGSAVPFQKILETLREKLRDFNLSESSVRRDLHYIRDKLGCPIVYDKKECGWKHTSPFKFPSKSFSQDEILFLHLLKRVIAQHSSQDSSVPAGT